jgi:diaminopimelate epimerase
MRFAKYHGSGNDFVMVEDLEDRLSLDASTIAGLCDRRRGVGADGLIRIVRTRDADFFMDYYNANGEVAEMCGNGIRCLAKLVYERGFTSAKELHVQTRSGPKRLVLDATDGVVQAVTVDMGVPALERKAIPMDGDPTGKFVGQTLEADGQVFTATAVSMGNPHCVVLLGAEANLGTLDLPRIGSIIEHLPLFPNRTNVEFVQVTGGRILARVWERGSGETMACGTGACASLVACSLAGLTGRTADLEFPGGLLRLRWGPDDHVLMTGPAVHVFDGEMTGSWAAATSADAGAAATAGAAISS